MASVNGQLTTCDRCGAQVFRKTTGESETDGGYTRWNNFEAYPEGWGFVSIPSGGKKEDRNLMACPKCRALWENILNNGFLRNTDYYIVEEEAEP